MKEDNLAALANFNKLRLTPEESKGILADFAQLFDSLEALVITETALIEPLLQVTPQSNVMREDTVVPMVSRDEILANAPEHDQGCFLAPKVLE